MFFGPPCQVILKWQIIAIASQRNGVGSILLQTASWVMSPGSEAVTVDLGSDLKLENYDMSKDKRIWLFISPFMKKYSWLPRTHSWWVFWSHKNYFLPFIKNTGVMQVTDTRTHTHTLALKLMLQSSCCSF